ncbi:MAG: hypothetical protein ABL949_09075 [Fimbriimonadaceae bacterium]
MGTSLIALLAVASSGYSIQSRTLLTGPVNAPQTSVILNQQIVGDGKVRLISRTVNPDKSLSYAEEVYTTRGTPISSTQEGFWSNRWNRFTTAYAAKLAKQDINGEVTSCEKPAKFFENPTVAWFWKIKPKVGESVVVNFLAQNVIHVFQIRFTYENDETLTLAGKTLRLHRVKEEPLSAKGVFSVYWYDDFGMIAKRYHKTTTNEYGYELTAWR